MSIIKTYYDFINNEVKKYFGEYNLYERAFEIIPDVFAYLKGMSFGSWIDTISGGSRDTATGYTVGYNEGDMIDNGYVIESILRDWLFSERDLVVTARGIATSGYDLITFEGLHPYENYYAGAIYHNVTTGFIRPIIASSVENKRITLSPEDPSVDVGHNIYITNIQGDNKIEAANFDYLFNATNGVKKDIKLNRSINKNLNYEQVLESLLFETGTCLFKSADKYKIFGIGDGPVVATLSNPLKDSSQREICEGDFTPVENLHNSYRIKFFYDYAKNKYLGEVFIDKNGVSIILDEIKQTPTLLNTTDINKCKYTEDAYKVNKEFKYTCDWLYSLASVERFTRFLINLLYKRRLAVVWGEKLSTGIRYEWGDVVKLNYSDLIPKGLNNRVKFQIMGKEIKANRKGDPYVMLSMLEVE